MKFSYCSIRRRKASIALQLQLPLLNLLLFIAPDYIIHTVADTVFPTLCLKQLIQLCGMWRITAVNIMIALFIQSAFSREIMIQLIVVIIPLIIPQSHAKCRVDKFRMMLCRKLDDTGDVFRCVIDEGKNGHHQNPRIDTGPVQFLQCQKAFT